MFYASTADNLAGDRANKQMDEFIDASPPIRSAFSWIPALSSISLRSAIRSESAGSLIARCETPVSLPAGVR